MDEFAEMCRPHPLADKGARGCAFRYVSTSGDGSVRCYVYIAPPEYLKQSGDTVEDILRHEKGHCAGWPGNHPREAAPATDGAAKRRHRRSARPRRHRRSTRATLT
jgi:hypothetical protein